MMARELRVQAQGFYYISNYSVEYRTLFFTHEDYAAILNILCDLSKKYDFTLHSYALLNSSYHLVLETKKDNLSKIMQQLNGRYAHYFNRLYKRSGTLWKGRFKSHFIIEQQYIYHFLQYIEQLPKKVRLVNKLEQYYFSSYRQFIGLDHLLSCMRSSIVFQRFNTVTEIKAFFSIEVTPESIDNICEILKKKLIMYQSEPKNLKNIKSFLRRNKNKKIENKSILQAYQEGFSQKEIANYLGISQQSIQKRLKRLQTN